MQTRNPATQERPRLRIGACALALLALQDTEPPWELARPDPAVALRPERLVGLEEYRCATCHAEVAAEWAESAHGLAWLDEVYRKELAGKRRPERCASCHVPEPLLADGSDGRPRARAQDRELGVSCEACHLGDGGTVLGPRGTQVEAHPSEVSERMGAPGSSELCAACHATDVGPVIGVADGFASDEAAERGLSCVGCHMAVVERRWARDPAGAEEDVPLRRGRSHAIQTPRDPAFLRRAFEVAWITEGRSRVVIRNRAGHRVPGLIGREIAFRAVLQDDSGQALETRELALDTTAYLPVGGSREIGFEGTGSTVHLTGSHTDPRADEAIVFLDERLSPDR